MLLFVLKQVQCRSESSASLTFHRSASKIGLSPFSLTLLAFLSTLMMRAFSILSSRDAKSEIPSYLYLAKHLFLTMLFIYQMYTKLDLVVFEQVVRNTMSNVYGQNCLSRQIYYLFFDQSCFSANPDAESIQHSLIHRQQRRIWQIYICAILSNEVHGQEQES